jgi:N-acetylglucosamine kinase-like BadF-type ATPase
MRYVLGVDGGGTKTHCALYDTDTGRLDMLAYGPTNHEGMAGGLDELPGVLRDMLRTLLIRNNITIRDIEMGVLGLAGVDTTEQHRIISGILTELGLERFVLCNDSYLGIKAGSSSGHGICAISGTGCSITGMDPFGNRVQVGGLGPYTGDFGGSSMLVPCAVGRVHDQLFREAPFTALTTAVFSWLDITDRDEFIDLLTSRLGSDHAGTTYELCRILHRTAGEGDETALAILEESGRSYAGGIAGAAEALSFPPGETVEVVFAGSLFTKADCDHAQKTAERLLLERFSGERVLSFKRLDVPCAAGAVLWAMDELGIGGLRDNVLKLFRGGVWLR